MSDILDLNSVDKNLTNLSDNELTKILLYGSTHYSFVVNRPLLNALIKYIENSKSFSGPLFKCSGINKINILMCVYFKKQNQLHCQIYRSQRSFSYYETLTKKDLIFQQNFGKK